jgi:hypothetical protein
MASGARDFFCVMSITGVRARLVVHPGATITGTGAFDIYFSVSCLHGYVDRSLRFSRLTALDR